MANEFRPYLINQVRLFAESPLDWLPDDHLAFFVHDLVSALDLRPILKTYRHGRGPRGYHPQMLLTVLFYGYCVGVFSSRKIAARCETDLAFRVLSGGEFPDFRTLAEFRRRHLKTFHVFFIEVLRLCREAGILGLGHLSLDGSKYQANASKHKAMSYGRIQEVEPQLVEEVQRLLHEAERADEAEDRRLGRNVRGDELPEELRRREGRLEKIRAAKERLEARAKERARTLKEAHGASPAEVAEAEERAVPHLKEQTNFTDPESRIMKTKTGWVQGYNAQVMVDEGSGLIVAQEVVPQSADSPRLVSMLDRTDANLKALALSDKERLPQVFTADAGYCSEKNLLVLEERGIDSYVATGRERHHRAGIDPHGRPRTPRRAAMRQKLQTEAGRAIYARRKAITEPVHGLIKQARGFRQFLLRGLVKVQGEFTLIALTHNLLKLWRAQRATLPA